MHERRQHPTTVVSDMDAVYMISGIARPGPGARGGRGVGVTGVLYRFGCLLLKRAKMIKIQTTLGGLKQWRRLTCSFAVRSREQHGSLLVGCELPLRV